MITKTAEQKLKERAEESLGNIIETLSLIFPLYQQGSEGDNEVELEHGYFPEYALSFDFVESDTFRDQDEAYFRYQLSYGGPTEEFRFYINIDGNPYKIEFWFLDWFVGHYITIHKGSTEWELMNEIFNHFHEMGMTTLE